jgi:hypothetical protein
VSRGKFDPACRSVSADFSHAQDLNVAEKPSRETQAGKYNLPHRKLGNVIECHDLETP